MFEYPIKLKASTDFVTEFYNCEEGRYEDTLRLRNSENIEDRTDAEKVVVCEFLNRYKSVIEVRNDDELVELYYALASGTIGLSHYRLANRLLDQIRGYTRLIDPELVKQWPCRFTL